MKAARTAAQHIAPLALFSFFLLMRLHGNEASSFSLSFLSWLSVELHTPLVNNLGEWTFSNLVFCLSVSSAAIQINWGSDKSGRKRWLRYIIYRVLQIKNEDTVTKSHIQWVIITLGLTGASTFLSIVCAFSLGSFLFQLHHRHTNWSVAFPFSRNEGNRADLFPLSVAFLDRSSLVCLWSLCNIFSKN